MKLFGKMSGKDFGMNVLNGLSLGVVVSLISGALFGNLAKALDWTFVSYAVSLAQSLMGVIIGVTVGIMFKFTPIQSGALGLACTIGGGVAKFDPNLKGFIFTGSGDAINIGITAAVGAFIILLVGDKLKGYSILVMPPLMTIVAGGIGYLTLPYVKAFSAFIGKGIANFTTLQPIFMTILLGMAFSLIILSPISSVGIATAVGLSGIAAGSVSLGITAASFTVCVAGWKVNSLGNSLAPIVGSPKIHMANIVKKPIITVPILCNAATTGLFAYILGVKGTAFSAGFGISGLVGPIAALNEFGGPNTANLIKVGIAYFVVPLVGAIVYHNIFSKVIKIETQEDFRLNF